MSLASKRRIPRLDAISYVGANESTPPLAIVSSLVFLFSCAMLMVTRPMITGSVVDPVFFPPNGGVETGAVLTTAGGQGGAPPATGAGTSTTPQNGGRLSSFGGGDLPVITRSASLTVTMIQLFFAVAACCGAFATVYFALEMVYVNLLLGLENKLWRDHKVEDEGLGGRDTARSGSSNNVVIQHRTNSVGQKHKLIDVELICICTRSSCVSSWSIDQPDNSFELFHLRISRRYSTPGSSPSPAAGR